MVAKIVSGKNMRGALNYNEQKVAQGKAECILANLFQRDLPRLTFRDKLERFNKLHERNRRSKTNTLHISLNFDRTDKLNVKDLQDIAIAYMDKIGFGEQPFLVYEHRDAAHPHIHILTTLIQRDGKRIPIHNLGKNQSEEARKAIERDFQLVEASSRSKAEADYIRPVDIEKVIYGKSETRRSITSVVRAVTKSYRYTSLSELNAVLGLYNVRAVRGNEDSQMYLKRGLLYSIVDSKGNSVGVPVKASAIYGKPTRAFLEMQYKLNEVLRSPHRKAFRDVIDRALNSGVKSRADFINSLSNQQVIPIFRENSEGRIYGLTFVDLRRQVVFKGSDLGKAYSATSVVSRLQENHHDVSSIRAGYTVDNPQEGSSPSSSKSFTDILKDILSPEATDKSNPEAMLKLSRKRRKRKKRGL